MSRPRGGRRLLLSPTGLGLGVAMGLGILVGWPLAWAAGIAVGFVLAALWTRRLPGLEAREGAEAPAPRIDPRGDLGVETDRSTEPQLGVRVFNEISGSGFEASP